MRGRMGRWIGAIGCCLVAALPVIAQLATPDSRVLIRDPQEAFDFAGIGAGGREIVLSAPLFQLTAFASVFQGNDEIRTFGIFADQVVGGGGRDSFSLSFRGPFRVGAPLLASPESFVARGRRCRGMDPRSTLTLSVFEVTPPGENGDSRRQVIRAEGTFNLLCEENGLIPFTGDFRFARQVADGGDGGDGGSGTPVPAPPLPFQVSLPAELAVAVLGIANSAQKTIEFDTQTDGTFAGDLHLSAFSDALETDDFHVEVNPSFIAAPGAGTSRLSIRTGPTTRPRIYTVTVLATSGDLTSGISLQVEVTCTPPFIFGVDQPVAGAGPTATQVSFRAAVGGTGPLTYQWYEGFPGMTRNPVSSQGTLTVPKTASTYWYRVSNACGTVDSNAVTVTP